VDGRPLVRRGFFAALKVVPWGQGVYPHEKTLPTHKVDRGPGPIGGHRAGGERNVLAEGMRSRGTEDDADLLLESLALGFMRKDGDGLLVGNELGERSVQVLRLAQLL
jgi:hypothetical protein